MLNLSNLPAAWNPGQLDETEATNVINHVGGVRAMDFSFRLLNRDLTPVEVPGSPNADDPAEMPPNYIYAGTYQMNTLADVPQTMTMDMIEGPGLSYDPMHHLIQPCLDYYAGGTYTEYNYQPSWARAPITWYKVSRGQRLLHIPLATLMAVMPDVDYGGQYPVWHLNLTDEAFRLARLKFGAEWPLLNGNNWIQLATTLATLPATGAVTPGNSLGQYGGCSLAGPGFPLSRVNIPASASTCPIDDSWKQSDTFIKAINDCLLGSDTPYWNLWFDRTSNLTSGPKPFYTTALPTPGWIFDTTPGNPAIIAPPVKQQYDTSQLANSVTVYGENPNGPAVAATAINNNADSAISYQNLGYIFNQTLQMSSITTEDMAYLQAQFYLQSVSTVAESVNFSCLPVPVMEPHDAIGFTVRGPGTTRYIGSGRTLDVEYTPGAILIDSSIPFEVISYQIDCVKRQMSVTAGRAVGI